MNPRISELKKLLGKNFDAFLISNPFNIFYFSSFSFLEPTEHEGYMLITKDKNYLITSSLYSEAVKEKASKVTLLEITSKKSLEQNIRDAVYKHKIKKIAFESENLTISEYKKFRKISPMFPTNQLVEKLRQIKNPDEIEKIQKACKITDDCFNYIIKQIKLGVTEIEIQNKINRFFEDLGHMSSFSPVVAFGPHSSMPHHISNKTKLQKNQIVLLDFGAKYEGYSSDMTRTLFFGTADKKFKDIYNTVFKSQEESFRFLSENAKAKFSKADQIARDFIIEQKYPNIPHSLGHGLGIEVHDGTRLSPTSKDTLKENMVFTLEPGIYIPGYGGVRIEDDVVFSNKKLKYLTHSEKHLIEL